MPMFYFDYVVNGRKRSVDDEGSELKDENEALVEAVQAMAEYAKDELSNSGPELQLDIEVRDGNSRPILKASLHFETRRYQ
jgi:hypothetical protein